MWFRTLMNVSCARSSEISRSRTMRKIREKTGRSYRRRSSRNAASRPCWASLTTSASGRVARSIDGAMHGPAAAPREESVAGGGRKLYLSVRMPTVDLETTEARAAAAGGAEKRAYVRRIFSEIAPRYDLLNHLLSFNIDRRWRRRAIAMLDPHRAPMGLYVDLCAGTLDVAAQLSQTAGFRGLVL